MRRSSSRALGAALVLLWLGAGNAAAGELFRLQQPRTGKAAVVETGAPALHLVLFATWCDPCREELERLTVLEERWRERGYRLVLIAVPTRQTRERLARFLEDQSPPGELLFDPDGSAQARLKADELPTHVLLDASGREVLRAGRLSGKIDAALERLLLPEEP